MGLASTQVRLLALTYRVHDIESKAQRVENNIIGLSTQKQNAFNEYNAALDAQKLRVAFNDSTGTKSYVDANFSNVCMYQQNRAQQYALKDSKTGKVYVDDETASAYTMYGSDRYAFATSLLADKNNYNWQMTSVEADRIGYGWDTQRNNNFHSETDITGSDKYTGSFIEEDGKVFNYSYMNPIEQIVFEAHQDDQKLMNSFNSLTSTKDSDRITQKEALANFRDTLYSNEIYVQEIMELTNYVASNYGILTDLTGETFDQAYAALKAESSANPDGYSVTEKALSWIKLQNDIKNGYNVGNSNSITSTTITPNNADAYTTGRALNNLLSITQNSNGLNISKTAGSLAALNGSLSAIVANSDAMLSSTNLTSEQKEAFKVIAEACQKLVTEGDSSLAFKPIESAIGAGVDVIDAEGMPAELGAEPHFGSFSNDNVSSRGTSYVSGLGNNISGAGETTLFNIFMNGGIRSFSCIEMKAEGATGDEGEPSYVATGVIVKGNYNIYSDELQAAVDTFVPNGTVSDVIKSIANALISDVKVETNITQPSEQKLIYEEDKKAYEDAKAAVAWSDVKDEFNYYLNLYDVIKQAGGCIEINAKYEAGEEGETWFQNIISSGQGIICEFNSSNKMWKETDVPTNTSSNFLQFVQDERDMKRAEQKYEYELDVINQKDTRYQKELKALETERTSLNTEIDSYKTIKNDNMDRTLKIFV